MSKKRISIVGAGPAGLYAAEKLAQQGYETNLFDHKVPWEKPCGGMIPPETLREFTFLYSFPNLKGKFSRIVYESPDGKRKRRPFTPSTYIVSRKELAEFQLKRAIDAGAKLIPEKVEKIRPFENNIELTTENGVYQADYIIGADGANSVVRKAFIGKIPKENLGITFGYTLKDVQVDNNEIKFQDTDGCIWLFNGEKQLNAGIGKSITSKNNQHLRDKLDQYIKLKFGNINVVSKWNAIIPLIRNPKFLELPICGNSWVLVGDAAGHVDPISGEGIYYALKSAKLAVEAIISGHVGEYEKRWRKSFGRIQIERVKYANYAEELAGKSRYSAIGSVYYKDI